MDTRNAQRISSHYSENAAGLSMFFWQLAAMLFPMNARARMVSIVFAEVFMLSAAPIAAAQEGSPALRQIFNDRYAWEMREFPEMAMSRGDYSNADRISDNSLAAIERRHAETKQVLERLAAIDKSKLDENDRLNYELFDLQLRNAVEEHRFRTFLAPLGSRHGPHQEIPQMHERVRFNTYEDYANYLKRLEQTPRSVQNTLEALRLGLKEGRTPPRVTMTGVPNQFKALRDGGLKALAEPFDKMPAALPEAQRKELRARFDTVSFPAVRDALARFGEYVEKEYVPNCRQTLAARDLPDGEEFYAFQLRVFTTTNLTAKEIHETGLREVAWIKAEMLQVIRKTDFMQKFPDAARWDDQKLFKEFVRYLRTDPRFYHKTPEELLTGYRDICKRIDAALPKVFKTLPRLSYGVRAIPDFMAPTQTTAYYSQGDIRNAEPGYFYANTYALDQRPKYEMIALAIHEAVPGHHFQIALAQEIENAPEFRKDAWFTAFGEGWALYSERLGIEMGLYENPYDDFGRLTYEMWRACRLVVDPGVHALGWTREQALQFMLDNTALSETNITAEVDRYISWPAQATAYKIGELKIRELRQRAEQKLGQRFDLREFHDVVLKAGTLPLTVLERRIDDWIAAKGK